MRLSNEEFRAKVVSLGNAQLLQRKRSVCVKHIKLYNAFPYVVKKKDQLYAK